MKAYIIAEAGVNHNGNIDLAYKMIDEAARAGVDCIKFQTFKSEKVVSKFAEKAEYQKQETGIEETQLEMVKKLELSFNDFINLKKYAEGKGLDFCSTAFDSDSIEFLHTLKIPFWKIPSGEVTNLPYLIKIAEYNEPIVMSTGMCTLNEIQESLTYIRKYNDKKIILLHCNTEYPTPYEDVNLNAMQKMKEEFNCEIGFSDHTLGIEVPIAARALGAVVIEKHFTLDKNMEGPDHKASLEPEELKNMITAIRNIEKALGKKEKRVTKSENKNKAIVRKSIVASKNICKGEILSEDNLTCKRPGNGISPMRWFEIIGKVAEKDYEEDELIII